MKKINQVLALAGILLLLLVSNQAHAQAEYGWTISNSTTDPFSNSGTATFGVATVYLWYQCVVESEAMLDGMASAAFDISSTGIVHLATITQNTFLNAGGTSNLLLAVGACPPGPVVAANLLITDLPGEMCFATSSIKGVLGTVDCAPAPSIHDMATIGYSNQGAPSCADPTYGMPPSLCPPPDPVEQFSWGGIKGLYR